VLGGRTPKYLGAKGVKKAVKESENMALRAIDAIADDFAILSDWDDRYRYIIELGRTLEPLPASERNAATKVSGCVSQVWIAADLQSTRLHFRGDSDSSLVKGLIAIALSIFNDKTPQQILAIDAHKTFLALGLDAHLTPQRSNGVRAMILRIKADAASAA
jgi:cysteine desulfuration protein SufE